MMALEDGIDDELDQMGVTVANSLERRKIIVITDFVERTIPMFDDKQFKRHFRSVFVLSRNSFFNYCIFPL